MNNILKKTWPILTIVFLLGVNCFGAEPVYVSTKGDDAGQGTLKHPLLTLERARDVVRTKRSSGDKGPFSILLREGDYYFTQTLKLTEQDKELTIAPYKNEKVRFTGGISIDPAKAKPVMGSIQEDIFPLSNRNHILMVNLRELGITDYGKMKQVGFNHPLAPSWMELFINGKPGHVSRWPNDSSVAIEKIIEKGSIVAEGDNGNTGGKFAYPGNRPNGWKSSDDIWIFGYFRYGWADDAVKLASIDTIGKTFTTGHPHMYGYYSGRPWNAWYAYNIPEEIDAPGEYYIDRHEGILYFYNPGEIKQLEISILEDPIIAMEGASGITISSISVECARGTGVEISGATDCRLTDCTIRNLGLYAVNLSDGEGSSVGKKNGIISCSVFNTGAGGIHLGGGDRQTLEAAGNFVENCSIHDYNRIAKTYCAGVQIMGVGNRISHCEIFNAPHFAIQLFGNDHLIEYNDIHDVCQVTDDVGALYYGRNPSMRGHLVRFNYFHHISDIHSSSAVYHDDGACGMEVFGNVFYKAGKMPVLIGGGSDNPYINNIFIDCPIAFQIDDRLQSYDWAMPWVQPGNLFEQELNEIKYNQPPYSLKYPEFAKYWDDNPAFPKRNRVDKNVFVRINKIIKGDKKWLEYSGNNYVTNEDPGFENEKEQNFKLKESSEIFRKVSGFQSIPFEKIGIDKTGREHLLISSGANGQSTDHFRFIDNGKVRLGIDMSGGGSIFYFAESKTGRNLLNHFDKGRFIQQSYYGDSDSSFWAKQPWCWNPVQGGGYLGEPAKVQESNFKRTSLYLKSRPKHWATGVDIDSATMEETITLKGEMAHIHYRFCYTGKHSHRISDQELPAVFVDYDLPNLFFYKGNNAWKNEALMKVVPGWPNEAQQSDECWAAYTNDADWGIGVYTPGTTRLTSYRHKGNGKGGPESSACSYFAPVGHFRITPGFVYEYDVYLTIGKINEIRDLFYRVHSKLL